MRFKFRKEPDGHLRYDEDRRSSRHGVYARTRTRSHRGGSSSTGHTYGRQGVANARRTEYNRGSDRWSQPGIAPARGRMEGPPGTCVWPPVCESERRGVRLHGEHPFAVLCSAEDVSAVRVAGKRGR